MPVFSGAWIAAFLGLFVTLPTADAQDAIAPTSVQPASPSPREASPALPDQDDKTRLKAITVEGKRERAIIERQVNAFVSGIVTQPFEDSLARWQSEMVICPLVTGLPVTMANSSRIVCRRLPWRRARPWRRSIANSISMSS